MVTRGITQPATDTLPFIVIEYALTMSFSQASISTIVNYVRHFYLTV